MRILVIALVVILVGCPANGTQQTLTSDCDAIGDRCRVSPGKIGVCSASSDGGLYCMSQH